MPYQPVEVPFGEDWEVVRRNFQALRRDMNPPVPQARVYNDANESIANNTETTVTFNQERYDNGDLHSTSSNTGRLTAPITGLYSIGACVQWASNATGYRQVRLRLNGATAIDIDERAANAVAGRPTIQTVGTDYQLVAGDYVEVRVAQDSGGALNVQTAANYSPEFWMHRVAGYVNQGV